MFIEHRILTLAADVSPDDEQIQKLRCCFSPTIDINMDRLIDLAAKEGLEGFLYTTLLKADLLETLEARHVQKLHTAYQETICRNHLLIQELKAILQALNQNGIQIVLIQGLALLHQVYRDSGLRPLNDMDTWVLPDHYQNLVSCLVAQGFERDSRYPNTFSKGEAVLDIHTQILGADRIGTWDGSLRKKQQEIFANTVNIHVEGCSALCLNPQDQFLNLGLHALEGNLKRLLWLADIKNLVADWEDSDWKALERRAEQLGLRKILVYLYFTLNAVFNLTLPPARLAHLERWKPTILERKILTRRVSGHSIPSWARLILISADKGMRERISFFMQTLFPGPDALREIFADGTHLSAQQLYWRRVLQILGVKRVSR